MVHIETQKNEVLTKSQPEERQALGAEDFGKVKTGVDPFARNPKP